MFPERRAAGLRLAADAAELRAQQCRRRLATLRSASPWSDSEDAVRAEEYLASAVSRAEAAERRLAAFVAANQRRHASLAERTPTAPCLLPERLADTDPQTMAGALSQSVLDGSCSVRELWLTYATYGGECDYWHLVAYLHGVWAMPESDRVILEQVWWEHERLG